jgi:5-oxoprolinase (ATP-hydrolysing) subunit A
VSATAGRIDLNADVGEGGDDAELAPYVSSLNIACGAHAGDEGTMRAALGLARDHGLAVGAHPGYADRERFGRVETGLPAGAIAATVLRQVGELAALGRESGLRLAHVKPHGALYHRLSADAEASRAFAAAVASLDRELAVVGFPGSELLAAAAAEGLPVAPEGFADRGYAADGNLLSRSAPGALLAGKQAVRQALALAPKVRTLCLHSDTPEAAALARALRLGLESAGWRVASFAPSWRVPPIPEVHVVGAAIVERGRVLLTRRGARMSMAGKWEFPGGKVERDEATHEALRREVAEELGLAVEVGDRIGRGTSFHDGRRIVLEVYAARRQGGELALREHAEHGWFAAGELAALDWPEADLPILPALRRRLETAAG